MNQLKAEKKLKGQA